MLRLLALLILLGLGGAGYYYWKGNPGAAPPRSLRQAQQQLKDVALTGAVKTALSLHKSLKPYAVAVTTEDAIVTLRGEIPSAQLATAAERVAAAVPDVRQVVSHLKVNAAVAAAATEAGDQRSLGERLDDEALELQVRIAFSLDRSLKDAEIGVESWRKQVRLSGSVPSAEARRLAVQTASDVAGVSSVSDRLAVQHHSAAERNQRAPKRR